MLSTLQGDPRTIPGTELVTSPIVLGGNTFGWTSDAEQSFAVLEAYAEAGGIMVDTADVYSVWADGHTGGESESILGQWMSARGNREEIVVATKAGMLPPMDNQDRTTVTTALEASLERLQTDYVDVFYAHQDDENVTIEEQAETYDALVRSGKVRHIGLSNYAPQRMRRWFEHATAQRLAVPVAIQPQYNLVFRQDYEHGYRPIAEEFDAAVFSYFSLASGFLTGKYRSLGDLEGKARQGLTQGYVSDAGLKVVDELLRIADAQKTSAATVALSWLLAKGITAPIASARNPEQLQALLAAPTLQLTEAEVNALDAVSQPFA